MLTVNQQPDSINYSLSLPHVKVVSTNSTIDVKLFKAEQLIIDETYDQPPADGELVLKFSEIADLLLSGTLPDYNQTISVQSSGVANFKLELSDLDETKEILFTVVKGYVRRQPFDVNGFLRDSWLNIVPAVSEVTFHQPLYLSAYPPINVTAIAKGRLIDGSDKIITLGTLNANVLYSINLNPGRMIQLFDSEYEYFDVYTLEGSAIRNGYKRFVFSNRFEFDGDTFLYLNRLGGWDTLMFSGEHEDQNANTISTGLFDENEYEFNQTPNYSVLKNSGYIKNELHRKQCIDFLYSKQRYHLHDGALRPIVLNNPETNLVKGELNSFAFTFRYSDTKTGYPELGIIPYNLIIQ
ncbi:hypothetical protein HP439_11400 [Sphingobacterium shayense]|uniref:hypothetical protein n=1 Tax=Sphingobacterium shayense TaxID=626343 RepID=UPI0015555B95|nr:hypothetical protein [Sphingobacterium shayense]NQD71326.1 hypothetical protein [Sphingobacterium shayense]